MGEIILEKITLEDFEKYQYAVSCEDCTHFDFETGLCVFGFPTKPHRRENQLDQIKKTGKIAFCRQIEID